MSSNIRIQRICNYCKKEFTAKTTRTLYCSHKCNSADYKQKIKGVKITRSHDETRSFKTHDLDQIKAKEFLTARDVSILLNASIRTVYRLIDQGTIKAVKISARKTIVKRSDIDNLFNQVKESNEADPLQGPLAKINLLELTDAGDLNLNEYYSLKEVQDKYSISNKTINDLIISESIPRLKAGWFEYVPKIIIDRILG